MTKFCRTSGPSMAIPSERADAAAGAVGGHDVARRHGRGWPRSPTSRSVLVTPSGPSTRPGPLDPSDQARRPRRAGSPRAGAGTGCAAGVGVTHVELLQAVLALEGHPAQLVAGQGGDPADPGPLGGRHDRRPAPGPCRRPADRRISNVRALTTWAAGAAWTSGAALHHPWSIPCRASSSDVTRPTGPPPTTSTVVESAEPVETAGRRPAPSDEAPVGAAVEVEVLARHVARRARRTGRRRPRPPPRVGPGGRRGWWRRSRRRPPRG